MSVASLLLAPHAIAANGPAAASDAYAFARSFTATWSCWLVAVREAVVAITTIPRTSGQRACDRFIARPSESQSQSELEDPRITDCGDLVERGHRVRWIGAGTEIRVTCQRVRPVRQVECFHQPFGLDATGDGKCTTESKVQTEEVAPDSRVPRNQRHGPHVEVRRGSRAVGERTAVG